MTSTADATATRIPEWFIGGPWHGRDRITDCPTPDVGGRIIAQQVPTAKLHEAPMTDEDLYPSEPERFHYVCRRLRFGSTMLTVWVDETMPDLTAQDHLAAILLAPHRVPVAS